MSSDNPIAIEGYLVLGFLSIWVSEKSRFGARLDRKRLEQKFKIIGKLNSSAPHLIDERGAKGVRYCVLWDTYRTYSAKEGV